MTIAPSVRYPCAIRPTGLGPVNAMDANGWHGASNKAAILTKIGSEDRASSRGEQRRVAPQGGRSLRVAAENPIAALQSLAGCPTRLRLRALRWAFSAMQRVHAHSVNRS